MLSILLSTRGAYSNETKSLFGEIPGLVIVVREVEITAIYDIDVLVVPAVADLGSNRDGRRESSMFNTIWMSLG